MDSTPTLVTTSDSDPKTVCIDYILQLAVSFHHFSNTNQIAFRVTGCDRDNCESEKITIWLTNRFRRHRIVAHLTNINVNRLIAHLEEWCIDSNDYCFHNLRYS